MKLIIELRGSQTPTHCSGESSADHCEKLGMGKGKCKLFKDALRYDFDNHAYMKCEKCKEGSAQQ